MPQGCSVKYRQFFLLQITNIVKYQEAVCPLLLFNGNIIITKELWINYCYSKHVSCSNLLNLYYPWKMNFALISVSWPQKVKLKLLRLVILIVVLMIKTIESRFIKLLINKLLLSIIWFSTKQFTYEWCFDHEQGQSM